jgi:O-antigen/teichoic acid export membrane protein
MILKDLHKKYHTISINAIASFSQVIVTVICYFFLYKYLLKHLGVKELGLWSLIVASTSVVGIGNLGIGGGVLKFVAAADAHKDYKKIKTIVHTGLFTMLPIMALIALILYLILPSILSGVVSHELFPLALQLLPLSLLNLLLGACAGIFSATIDGIQFIYFRNFIAATLTIIYLGLTIFFVPSLGLIGVVYAQIIQTCLMILAYLMIIYWKVPKFSIVRLRTNRNVFRELFGYGINFQIIS